MNQKGPLPDFVVIGTMRSGTTSMWRYLREHPDVYMAPKELQYFTEHFDMVTDWYRARFADARIGESCGEATADYMAREPAMIRLSETIPEARLIALLRNPVDRAWSHYWLLRARGRETRPFEAVIDTEMKVLATEGAGVDRFLYLLHGLYDVHLRAVLDLFPRDQLHVVVFETMVAEPLAVYASVCEFLGVDPTFVPRSLGRPVNRFVGFRSLRVREASKRLPNPVGRLVARLNTRLDAEYPALDLETRKTLFRFYAPHVERVEEILGHPIEQWHS